MKILGLFPPLNMNPWYSKHILHNGEGVKNAYLTHFSSLLSWFNCLLKILIFSLSMWKMWMRFSIRIRIFRICAYSAYLAYAWPTLVRELVTDGPFIIASLKFQPWAYFLLEWAFFWTTLAYSVCLRCNVVWLWNYNCTSPILLRVYNLSTPIVAYIQGGFFNWPLPPP